MPFTLSHAAAVLPLHRLGRARLPLAALMIGSLSPDFLYFLPYQPRWLQSHSLAGLFYFCWPAGLIAWLMFVRVLERPTLALLPDLWRGAFSADGGELNLRVLVTVSLALILGALTHIVWDAFTHPYPLAVNWPVLRTPLFEFEGRTRRLWWLLQHLSTMLGAAVLLIWAWRRRNAPRDPVSTASLPQVSTATRTVAVALIITGVVVVATAGYLAHSHIRFERRLFHLAIGGMAGGALAWLAVALWIRNRYCTATAGV